MQAIADRVGPTVDEIKQIPTSLPEVPLESMSPVFAVDTLADR